MSQVGLKINDMYDTLVRISFYARMLLGRLTEIIYVFMEILLFESESNFNFARPTIL